MAPRKQLEARGRHRNLSRVSEQEAKRRKAQEPSNSNKAPNRPASSKAKKSLKIGNSGVVAAPTERERKGGRLGARPCESCRLFAAVSGRAPALKEHRE